MPASRGDTLVERVVLVVLDGLRADAIKTFALDHFATLCEHGAATLSATTVSPSVTACAMTSLVTGASPRRHGCQSDRFGLPRPTGALDPLPRVLAAHGLSFSVYLAAIPWFMRPLARRMARIAGVSQACFQGGGSDDILAAASPALVAGRPGLVLMHWPDADRAGHDHGWMSPAYRAAARRMDRSLGELCRRIDLEDPATLLIAMADHGGGGTRAHHHDSEHPLDRTIPIALAGGSVSRGPLGGDVVLTDVPATILFALGIPQPESYAGQPLLHAFQERAVAA